MLLEKYRPKTTEEIIGHRQPISQIEEWIKSRKKGEGLFLAGKTGSGKSLIVNLLSKKLSLELIESHANEKRGQKDLKETIKKSSEQQSLIHKGKIILIDEAENLDSIAGVTDIIKESNFPVIILGEDAYQRNISGLRSICKIIKLNKIRSTSIEKFLKILCKEEKIEYEDIAINQLSKSCNGDLRSAINDIESLMNEKITLETITTLSIRPQERDIFNTLKILFKTNNIENARTAMLDSDKTPDEIGSWLEENIAMEYEDPEEIYKAYDYLSKADIFSSRMLRGQSQKFSIDMKIYGVALSKKEVYRKFTRYNFPKFIRKGKYDKISEKISKKLHVSKKKTSDYINLISLIIDNNLAEKLSLEKDEIKLINQMKKVSSPLKR